ncbi:UDP-forming cellulose synthase catalytic subunit [Microvirga pudoricolor]|uniref:UDP-forming cellulose synthase catalytic subunit n=1 Tax=Microvirga pudoricolor TaxID=2778729 RepID=UPI00195136EC|nr:UDP-forming cellulose synthase catalytic subunit [Microvirga pudoricolor]MBM6593210.1 UDP-forming cellulose synthase catalytic subunit [Microvirga pudoricolor]
MLRAISLGFLTVAVGAALLLVLQPVGTDAQWAIAEVCLLGMLAIKLLNLKGYWRHLFFGLGALVVLRFVYWRTTLTLPSMASLQDFIPGVIIYGAEMFCVVMLAMSLFVIARPITRPRAPQLTRDRAPTVDVFVPSYNEDASLLAITLSAAKDMDYPKEKLTVYLLDDGGTDQKVQSPNPKVSETALRRREELQELCRKLGVKYLTRERNVHAKAGNLSNGLLQSTGELVVVFDADHAPTKEFLKETVGYFSEDPKLFLVQTPHFFINADPIEKNLATFDRMPSENEMFYSIIQKGLDKWNAAFFCGSAAVLRRTALEQAGGFAGTSITEDCETALELHSSGWTSLYVDKPLIAGLQPETFASFIGQRTRWCTGMLQIFLMKNPVFKRGLSLAQRICYLSTCMFWLFPIPRMIFLAAPLLFIFFDLKIYNATVAEFGAYTLTYLVAALLMQSYAYGRVRWPWVSELYEYVQSVYLFPAIISVIRNPRRPTFNVTAKGDATDDDRLSDLAWPYFAIFGVLLAATVMVGYRLHNEPDAAGLLGIVGLWNLFNLIMAGLALGVVSERRERRRNHRVPAQGRGALQVDDTILTVQIVDVSQGGMLVRAHGPGQVRLQSSARLAIPAEQGSGSAYHYLPVKIASVRTNEDDRMIGLTFASMGAAEYSYVARLMYGDLSVLRGIRAARQGGRSIILGTGQFLGWGLRQTLRGLYFALFRRSGAAGANSHH